MNTGKHDLIDRPYLKTDFADAETNLGKLLRTGPIPTSELAENTGLFVSPRTLKRTLFFNHIYNQAIDVHGIIVQFGVRWGRDLATLHGLRAIYEPFNAARIIVGFDTFEGFPSTDILDGDAEMIRKGVLSVSSGYEEFLDEVILNRQAIDPLPHLNRLKVYKGNAPEQLQQYLDDHPETIIALAHFDMDLYEPTKLCLEIMKPYLTKGSVIAFDELVSQPFPGETIAVREFFGLNTIRIKRSPQYSGHGSYVIID